MTSLDFIDLYCERTAAGFWNEPVNAISNLGFVLVAIVAWRVAKRRCDPSADLLELVLFVLAALIGVGSFLFHTLANSRAELADVIPIWSFVGLYVFTVIYRSTGQNILKTSRIAVIALIITGSVFWFTSGEVITNQQASDHSADRFNGSLQYLPALVALAGFGFIAVLRRHPARVMIVGAAVTFTLSLVMRSVDLIACDATGIGTHFLWHLLNALMVGILLIALVKEYPPASAGKRTA
ncbi:MAG: ceramidase domain-containing protein [Rhodobacteraceae bacterium]|nr:ceramidase domain-containing protein [Paracoccaceae bacterium]